MLPFTREQFFAVFADYHRAVGPAPLLAYALALGMLVAVLGSLPGRGRLVAAGLALLWAWTGVVYHGLYFAAINRAALGFAALFVLQALLFLEAGVLRGRLVFDPPEGWRAALGACLVAYATLLYPLIGALLGHRHPAAPSFGVTPCPLTIFSFGMLLLARTPVPWRLLVIPLLWSLIGGSAAFLLGVPQDWPLLASALCVLALRPRRNPPSRGAHLPSAEDAGTPPGA